MNHRETNTNKQLTQIDTNQNSFLIHDIYTSL